MSEKAGKTILIFTRSCARSSIIPPRSVLRHGTLGREVAVEPLCVSTVVIDQVFLSDVVHGVDLGMSQLLELRIEVPV